MGKDLFRPFSLKSGTDTNIPFQLAQTFGNAVNIAFLERLKMLVTVDIHAPIGAQSFKGNVVSGRIRIEQANKSLILINYSGFNKTVATNKSKCFNGEGALRNVFLMPL